MGKGREGGKDRGGVGKGREGGEAKEEYSTEEGSNQPPKCLVRSHSWLVTSMWITPRKLFVTTEILANAYMYKCKPNLQSLALCSPFNMPKSCSVRGCSQ